MAKGAIIKQGIVYSGGSSSSTGENNVIEKISVNGTELEVTDKSVNIDLEGYTTDEELSTTLEDYVLDSDIEVLTAEKIEELIGLSADEITNLASLLSDTTIEIGKSWSSSKIYSELNTILDSAKQYTLDELAKSIGASYKVVDSVDGMTSAKVLYLLKDTDSGLYNIYIYDEDTTTAELIGSFEINLEEYLKISDAESTYVLQTVFDVLSGNIGDVTNLTTDEKQIVSAINELDATVDKILDGTTVVPKAIDAETLNGLTAKELSQNNAKNLIPYPYDGTTQDRGVVFNDNGNGTISAVGQCTTTSAPYYNLAKNMYLNAGTYTLSPCTDDENAYIGIFFYDKTNNTQVYSGTSTGTRSESGSVFAFNTTSLGMDAGERIDSVTFTIDDDAYVTIQLRTTADNSVAVNLIFKPMLEVGTIAHDYVQYVGNTTVEISEEIDNQIQTLEDGLFVGRPYREVTTEIYENLTDEERNNGTIYFITDAEPTQNGSVNTDADTLDGYHADGLPYLPTTGGTIKGRLALHDDTNYTDVQVKRTQADDSVWYSAMYAGDAKQAVLEVHDSTDNTTGSILRMDSDGMKWGQGTSANNTILHSGNVDTYALPTTGGTQYKNVSIYNHISTDLRDVLYGIDHNGALIVKDDTNGKYLIVSSVDGATTYYGNLEGTASGNLPITGGTITGSRIDLLNGYGHIISGSGFLQFGAKNAVDSSDNMRALIVHNSNAKTLNNSVQLIDKVDGEVTTYDVVHSGNVADYACTTTVADVPFTEVTLDTTKVTKNDDSSYLKYCVKNGVCYLSCYGIKLVSLPTSTNHTIVSSDKLPIPSVYTSCPLQVAAGNESPSTPMFLEVMADGTVRIFSKDSLGAFYGTLSYPVAEN